MITAVEAEIGRVRRLLDAAAVMEEHGDPEAVELRAEAEIRTVLLALAGESLRVRRENPF